MNLEEFREQHSGSPISLIELACLTYNHLDLDKDITYKLYQNASSFIEAYNAFTSTLDNANIELG
jgi:hypothetical protein